MNTKYLLRCLRSSFAADRACAVVRWVLAEAVRSDTVVCGGWNNPSYNGQTLSGCDTGRRWGLDT